MAADRFARLEVKENPKEFEPKKVTVAFGRQGVEKLVRCLGNEDVDVILHSLQILDASTLTIQKNVILLLKYRGVEALNALSQIPDERVVLLAIQNLIHVAAVNAGCSRMLETKTLSNVTQLLSSEETSSVVKQTAYGLLSTLSTRVECVKRLLKEDILEFLLERIEGEEAPALKIGAMKVIANCGRLPVSPRDPHKLVRGGGVAAVLGAGGGATVTICVKLLKHEHPLVAANAAAILQVCSVTEQGRDIVVEAGAVKAMVELLVSNSGPVRKAVSGALLSLTISEAGKKQFHRMQGCYNLIDRLKKEASPDVLQNTIKIVSSMCCFPAARNELKDDGAAEVLETVAAMTNSSTTKNLAQLAMQNVLWEP